MTPADVESPEEPAPVRERRLLDELARGYCLFLVALALYVLATGPLYWQIYEAYHTDRGSAFLHYLYWPLVQLSRIDAVNAWLNWYIGFWIGL